MAATFKSLMEKCACIGCEATVEEACSCKVDRYHHSPAVTRDGIIGVSKVFPEEETRGGTRSRFSAASGH